MIAIGTSLREARERRGFELAQIEAGTCIRANQLLALETEQFEKLPARVYARAFLREYAEFLGLDADQFLAEFDARFPVVEEEPFVPVGLPPQWRPPRHTGALVALVAFAGLAALGWKVEQAESPSGSLPARIPTQSPSVPAPAPVKKQARVAPTLVLFASRGPCWLEAHQESRAGRLLFRGMLEPGRRLRLPASHLWFRVGAPWNLEARLDGEPVALPGRVANVLVTRRAVHVTRA